MPFPKTPVQHQQTADQRIQDLLVGQMCDVWIIIRAQLGKDIPIKVLGGGDPEGSRLQHHKTMLLAHVNPKHKYHHMVVYVSLRIGVQK